MDQACRTRTDVYRLDLSDFSIHRLETTGAGPTAGISRHKAELVVENEQPAIKIITKEVQEWFPKESPDRILASKDEESTMTEEEDEDSDSTTNEGKELVTVEESKVFTLRIRDMRWI